MKIYIQVCCLTRYKSILISNYANEYDICVVKYCSYAQSPLTILYSMIVSQGNFKGAWTLKINCNKHSWIKYILLFL